MKKSTLVNYEAKVSPMDTVFYRDMKPFRKKLSNEIQSMKIPYPSTVYGSLFSCLLRDGLFEEALQIIQAGQEPDMKKYLRINHIGIYSDYKTWIPAPLDVYTNGVEIVKGNYYRIEVAKGEYAIYCMAPTSATSMKMARTTGNYLSYKGFGEYSRNQDISTSNIRMLDELFRVEDKVGIEIDLTTRRTKEEHLYRMQQIAFRDDNAYYAISGEMSESPKEGSHVLQIGGERKMAYVDITQGNDRKTPQISFDILGEYIKLILLSPMLVDHYMFLMSRLKDTNTMLTQTKIRGAVSDTLIYMGGYSMVKNKSKGLSEIIPAGSILILENEEFKGGKSGEIYDEFKEIMNELPDTYKGYNQFVIAPFDESEVRHA